MKKIFALLLAAFTLTSFIGCSLEPDYSGAEKQFSSESGFSITLNEHFRETKANGYTACYESSFAVVLVVKEAFEMFGEIGASLNLDSYAQFVLQTNSSKSPSGVIRENGVTYIEYKFYNEEYKTTYWYFTTMFKGDDAFWIVQFSTTEASYRFLRDYFFDWAKTVEV